MIVKRETANLKQFANFEINIRSCVTRNFLPSRTGVFNLLISTFANFHIDFRILPPELQL